MPVINLKERRMFLKGLGAYGLAIPFLPSLISKAQANGAGQAPVRFAAVLSKWGTHYHTWAPKVIPSSEVRRPGVFAMPLKNIPGPITPTLSTKFDGLRDKLTFITGLDILNEGGHNQAAPLSSGGGKGHLYGSVVGYTIDEIMVRSKKVYPTAVKTPAIRLSPFYSKNPSWSFWAGENVPYQSDAKAVANVVFGGGVSSAEFESRKRLQLLAIDKVLPEFNSVRNGSAISSVDKSKLENFADHLRDLQTRLENSHHVSCAPPAYHDVKKVLSDADRAAIYSNHIDLIVAAMACNLTRVAVLYLWDRSSVGSKTGASDHDNSHNRSPLGFADGAFYKSWMLDRVAEMMNKMDAISEDNGKTLLDNSIVFYGNELASGYNHRFQNMPVVVGGSAGGQIRTGNYIAYEKRPYVYHGEQQYSPHPMGRPYNDLLMDFMRCMGLSAEDWEMGKPGAGFGDYSYTNKPKVAGHYDSFLVGNRSKSLPYFLMNS